MLTSNYLKTTLFVLKEFTNQNTQILQGSGYDGIIALLDNLRGVEFPCVVLESSDSGSIQLYDGPVDTYTQSVWVMGHLGRDEDDETLYSQMKQLAMKVAAKILEDSAAGNAASAGIDWNRFSYMKRWGGQNARGYELIFTFRENRSLVILPSDLKPVTNGSEQ